MLGWQAGFLLAPFRAAGERCGPAVVSMWQGDSASLPSSSSVPDLEGTLESTGCGSAAAGRVADHGAIAGLAVLVLAVLDLTTGERRKPAAAVRRVVVGAHAIVELSGVEDAAPR